MSVMHRLRIYHALLAVTVVAAWASGEWELVHSWLGYGVALVLLLRLVIVLGGAPQLGLMRFYPHFEGLKLDNAFTHPAVSRTLLMGIAITVIVATTTGIVLDGGRTLGLGQPTAAGASMVEDDDDERGEGGSELLEEAHELSANLAMLLVLAHVGYLLAFKRPLARFMLFVDKG